MKARPILFSAPMVRALLAGTKTQTRRVVKPQPEYRPIKSVGNMLGFKKRCGDGYWLWPNAKDQIAAECSYGQPGDRLWVKEPTYRHPMLHLLTGEPLAPEYDGGAYLADDENVLTPEGFDAVWWYSRKTCPSIHMPRWASRILLEITSVRVERLQYISEADAKAEGIVSAGDGNGWQTADTRHCMGDPVGAYRSLWESINGPGSWDANPWVWVLEFKRVEGGAV